MDKYRKIQLRVIWSLDINTSSYEKKKIWIIIIFLGAKNDTRKSTKTTNQHQKCHNIQRK